MFSSLKKRLPALRMKIGAALLAFAAFCWEGTPLSYAAGSGIFESITIDNILTDAVATVTSASFLAPLGALALIGAIAMMATGQGGPALKKALLVLFALCLVGSALSITTSLVGGDSD